MDSDIWSVTDIDSYRSDGDEEDHCDSDVAYVTDGPVGQIGTLSPSTSSSEILVDPGGTLPSSNLSGILLPAMPVDLIGRWGH